MQGRIQKIQKEEAESPHPDCIIITALRGQLGPDYISSAGPVSRAALVCQEDFQLSIT